MPSAICVLSGNPGVTGTVQFSQENEVSACTIKVSLSGLAPGKPLLLLFSLQAPMVSTFMNLGTTPTAVLAQAGTYTRFFLFPRHFNPKGLTHG